MIQPENKMSCVSFALVLFCASLAFVAVPARAEPVGLMVNGTLFNVELMPGTSERGRVSVTNKSGTAPLPLQISFHLWNMKEDSDELEFLNSAEEVNAAKWFRLEDGGNDILKPGENKEINFLMDVPKTAAPGSYFVMMKFEAVLPAHYFAEGSSKQIPEIGSLFFIKISKSNLDGNANDYGAKLVSLALTSRNRKVKTLGEQIISQADAGFFDSAIQKLDIKILNDGLYHFKTDGFVEIKNWYGRVVLSVPLPERYLLPQKLRSITVPMVLDTDTQFSGFFTQLWHMLYGTVNEATYFGPYTAELNLNIPDGQPLVAEVSFWVVPWKFWLPLSVILMALVWLFTKFRQRLRLAFFALIKR